MTAGDQDAASEGCDVITTDAAMARLLDTDEPPAVSIHRQWTYPGTDTALRALTRDLLARTRDPDNTTPVLAVLDDDVDLAGLAPLLAQGHDRGVSALILGDWPDHTITVNPDGTTNATDPSRCHTLNLDAFAATLSTLDEIAVAYQEPINPPPETDENLDQHRTEAKSSVAERHEPTPDVEIPKLTASHAITSSTTTISITEVGEPLRLRLLGAFELTCAGEPVRIRRTKSRELLAFLATQTNPVSLETLVETIVPETAFNKARDHFNAVTTYARKDLRHATQQPAATMFILHNDGGYRLDPDWFTSDLIEFDNHVTIAKTTTDPAEKAEHLHAALALYTGEVACDIDSESTWLYPIRAHYADHAHTACLTLANHAASHANTTTAIDLFE